MRYIIVITLALVCIASCQEVQVCEFGNIRVLCAQIYDPVCGITNRPNGKQIKQTFSNHCLACSTTGVEFTVGGECENYPKRAHFCDPIQNKRLCVDIYNPVCGFFNYLKVQCFAYPCAINADNACIACHNSDVLYYIRGKCPKPGS